MGIAKRKRYIGKQQEGTLFRCRCFSRDSYPTASLSVRRGPTCPTGAVDTERGTLQVLTKTLSF